MFVFFSTLNWLSMLPYLHESMLSNYFLNFTPQIQKGYIQSNVRNDNIACLYYTVKEIFLRKFQLNLQL